MLQVAQTLEAELGSEPRSPASQSIEFPTLRLGCTPPWDRDVFLVLSLLGADPYIGVTWEYILHLLRMAQKEDDMLAVCHGED